MVAVCGEYYAFIYSAFNDWLDVIYAERINKQIRDLVKQTVFSIYGEIVFTN